MNEKSDIPLSDCPTEEKVEDGLKNMVHEELIESPKVAEDLYGTFERFMKQVEEMKEYIFELQESNKILTAFKKKHEKEACKG